MRLIRLAFVLLLAPAALAFDFVTIGAAAAGAGILWSLWPKCYFQPSFPEDFAMHMDNHVFGQHLAAKIIPAQIRAHIEPLVETSRRSDRASAHALVLSLHGNTGTGKTHVSNFIFKALFAPGVFHGHTFYATEFPDPDRVPHYKELVRNTILHALRRCEHSLFIFVDSHEFPPGVLDVLSEFADAGATNVNGIDYTRAIFVLQSNLCKAEINAAVDEHLRAGKDREELSVRTMENVLRACVKRSSEGISGLYRKHVVQYIPFLPLERKHVMQCIESYLHEVRDAGSHRKWKSLSWSLDVVDFLADQMDMVGEFSLTGCKTAQQKVNTHVLSVLAQKNKQTRPCGILKKSRCFTLWEDNVFLTMANGKVVIKTKSTQSQQGR